LLGQYATIAHFFGHPDWLTRNRPGYTRLADLEGRLRPRRDPY
jgi:hypothetical protein